MTDQNTHHSITGGGAKGLFARFGRDSIWGMAAEVVQVVVQLANFLMMTRALGKDGYAVFVALYALSAPMSGVLAGIPLAQAQHAMHGGESVPNTYRAMRQVALLGGLGLIVVGILLMPVVLRDGIRPEFVVLLLVEVGFAAVMSVATGRIWIDQGVARSQQWRMAVMILRTLVVLALTVFGRLTISTYAVLLFIAMGAMCAATLRGADPHRLPAERLPILPYAKSSALFSITIAALALQNDGDKIFMSANKLYVVLGAYGAAYRLVSLGLAPISAVQQAVHQHFLKEGRDHPERLFHSASRIALAFTGYGLLFFAGSFVLREIAQPLLGKDFEQARDMIVPLAPLVFCRAISALPVDRDARARQGPCAHAADGRFGRGEFGALRGARSSLQLEGGDRRHGHFRAAPRHRRLGCLLRALAPSDVGLLGPAS